MTFYQYGSSSGILIGEKKTVLDLKGMVKLMPNTTDAAGEKHVPVITMHDGLVEVSVGSVEHPMVAAHYITWIVLETTKGWQKKDLKPGEKPVASFALTEGDVVMAACEYCNLHGLWKPN